MPKASRACRKPLIAFVLLLISTLGGIGHAAAPDTADSDSTDRPAEPSVPGYSAGGRLSWFSADELDLVGDLWAWLPLWRGSENSLALRVETRTLIEDATSDLDFAVRDLVYDLGLAWRRRRWAVVGGQRGKEAVDRPGRAHVRYLALQRRSREWDDPAAGLRWTVGAGPVLDDRATESDAILRGELRWLTWRGQRHGFGFEVRLDALYGDSDLDADLTVGPVIELATEGNSRAQLFALYHFGDNPLGLGHDGVLAGISYTGQGNPLGPFLQGEASLAAGDDDRVAGQLLLRFASPELGAGLRAALLMDANLLTGQAADELYYLYDIGLEREQLGIQTGVYLYHRSNHLLAEALPEFTAINVLEIGAETSGWRRPGGSRRDLDARLRLGYLLNSDFGEDRRWHVRAGLRWRSPIGNAGFRPFVLGEAERGDVERERLVFGWTTGKHHTFEVEYRRDDQFLGPDDDAWLVGTRYAFGQPPLLERLRCRSG